MTEKDTPVGAITHMPTPGPWRVVPNGNGCNFSIASQHDDIVIGGFDDHDWGYGVETEANAHLIAAAPDLLSALELAADYIKDLDGGEPSTETGWKSDELLDVWLKATAAIARARRDQS